MNDLYLNVKKTAGEKYPQGIYGVGSPGRLNTNQSINIFEMTRLFLDWDFDKIAMGTVFALGIKDGKLYSWGDNSNGQTGQNTASGTTPFPTQIGTDTDWTHVDAGLSHSGAIRAGKLYTFGSNINGRTGLGTTVGTTLVPTQVGTDSDWTAISMADANSLAIKGGKLYSCGNNQFGQLGQGLPASSGTNVDVFTELDGGSTGWTDISVGYSTISAIKNGNVWTAGSNLAGRTGQGTVSGNTITITQAPASTDGNMVKTYCGGTVTFCIRASGKLWGAGSSNALGGGGADTNNFREVNADTDWKSMSVTSSAAAGIANSFMALKGTKLMGMGSNVYGQMGTPVPDYTEWTQLFDLGRAPRQLCTNFSRMTYVLM